MFLLQEVENSTETNMYNKTGTVESNSSFRLIYIYIYMYIENALKTNTRGVKYMYEPKVVTQSAPATMGTS